MSSSPVIFGTTARLTCNIAHSANECKPDNLQWYGGQNYTMLCRGSICRKPDKYSIKEESTCRFLLNIYNFSASDINCDYSCYYDTSYQRKMLALDDEHFACKY